MNKKRMASDVLIEIESKLDNILGYIRNIDFNNKLIIQRISKLEGGKVPVEVGSKVQKRTASTPSVQPSVSPVGGIVSDNSDSENDQKNSAQKYLVQQKITYSDDKNVILVNIHIFDSDNNLIQKTRTSSSGKWSVGLGEGKYKVVLNKPGSTKRPALSKEFFINVSSDAHPLVLDQIIVK
jgi:hypothetical protein